jgi:RNA polymerase sigma factor (sigma-70 family)
MTPDSELLRRYARTNSEDAFAELVKRHVNLVYSAALRQVGGDAHLAQDVAQTVFADLARKAGALSDRQNLTGWLYTSTHFAAAKIARTENRRRDREEKFMRDSINDPETGRVTPRAPEDWEQIRPSLDDAMHELNEADRDAILFRYFENQPFVQVGAKLGLNENAARMRVERALEKLRAIFTKRGITTAAALASAISANAVQLAPANLAAALTAGSVAVTGTGTFTLMKLMTMTNLKLGVGALAIAGAATVMVVQHQAQTRLLGESASLRQQIAQLKTDNQGLSNRLATIGDSGRLADEQFKELLRLRGEVGLLKQRTNELGKLREENQHLHNEVMAAQPQVQLPTQAQTEWHTTNTINAARFVALAMLIFEGDNRRYPTNFSQISSLTEGMTNQTSGIGPEVFELVNANFANNQAASNKIIFREKSPFRTSEGQWARTYVFANGNVEVQFSDDRHFTVFERQHMVAPPPSQ